MIPFDCSTVLGNLKVQPFTKDGLYFPQIDGRLLCAWPEPRKKRLIFGGIRRSDLPLVEKNGKRESLEISAAAGLVESSHVVFFDNNVIGADFNFYAPRVSALAGYLKEKAAAARNLAFDPLVIDDVGKMLDRIHEVTMFQLRIRPSYIEEVRKANADLGAAFFACQEMSDAGQVEVIIRIKPHSRDGKLNAIVKAVTQRLGRGRNLSENATKFVLGGRDVFGKRVDDVDILGNLVVAKKAILKAGDRSRAVDSEAAFSAIVEARNDLLKTIASAKRLSVL